MSVDLSHLRVGILVAMLTLLYGFGLGGAFGAAEDSIKGSFAASAESVKDTVYSGDEAAMGKVTSKSWTYMKRAHLHANGLGTSALVLILVLGATGASVMARRAISGALGFGALGYSSFWMFAGMRAPSMGSTGAAKESLEWLAIPSAGLCILGLLGVLVFFCIDFFVAKKNG